MFRSTTDIRKTVDIKHGNRQLSHSAQNITTHSFQIINQRFTNLLEPIRGSPSTSLRDELTEELESVVENEKILKSEVREETDNMAALIDNDIAQKQELIRCLEAELSMVNSQLIRSIDANQRAHNFKQEQANMVI